MRRPRVLFAVTHPMTAKLLLAGQLEWLSDHGFEVVVVSGPGPGLEALGRSSGFRVETVYMAREISPLRDAAAVIALGRLFRRVRPDIVVAGTPKAGFLGLLAAAMTRVPVRIYHLRGLRAETAAGLKRLVLEGTERIASACAHRIVAVGRSLADLCVARGYAPGSKVAVLGDGSSGGVDARRFGPSRGAVRSAIRASLGIGDDAFVVGFVGRLTRDKGVAELVEAFALLLESRPDSRLLVVGDFEAGDPVSAEASRALGERPAVRRVGFVPDTAPYYAAMDVLAFPSHREGFPNVPLEAAAAGLPVAGFRATGTIDAVRDGRTGTLVEVGDAEALGRALMAYAGDLRLAATHGAAGRDRALADYAPERVWSLFADELISSLSARGLPTPTDPGPGERFGA